MRKRCHRRHVQALPPPGLRPRMRPDQLRDLGLAHTELLDTVASGQADATTLWEYAGTVLTWWHASRLARAGMPEMDAQCELVVALVARWRRTGRVGYSGPELQLARDGVVYMDQLAELVTDAQARAAALMSETQLHALQQGRRPPALPPRIGEQLLGTDDTTTPPGATTHAR